MTSFQITYLIFGSFVISAGLVMVTTYSLTNPWWRTHIGRMMIVYAMAEVIMSALLLAAIVWQIHPTWFRVAWFILQATVGCTFWFQTYVIIRIHRSARSQEIRDARR